MIFPSRRHSIITAEAALFQPPPTTPGTTLNTPPPATSIANALTGGTGANGQGLSPIQQVQKDVSGEGGQALPPAPAPQLGLGDMHNAQVAAQAPALMAALAPGRRAALDLELQAVRLECGSAGACFARDNLELDRWRLCLTIRSPTP